MNKTLAALHEARDLVVSRYPMTDPNQDTMATRQHPYSVWGNGIARKGYGRWRNRRASSEANEDNQTDHGYGETCEDEDGDEETDRQADVQDSRVHMPTDEFGLVARDKQSNRRRGAVGKKKTPKPDCLVGTDCLEDTIRKTVLKYLRHPRRSAKLDTEIDKMTGIQPKKQSLSIQPKVVIPALPSSREIEAEQCFLKLDKKAHKRIQSEIESSCAQQGHQNAKKDRATMNDGKVEEKGVAGESAESARLRYLKWKRGY